MGISNVSSYRGSGLFEVIGFSDEVNSLCFPKNDSLIKGESFEDLHKKNMLSISFDGSDDRVAKGLLQPDHHYHQKK